jgi:hypothetical protein
MHATVPHMLYNLHSVYRVLALESLSYIVNRPLLQILLHTTGLSHKITNEQKGWQITSFNILLYFVIFSKPNVCQTPTKQFLSLPDETQLSHLKHL